MPTSDPAPLPRLGEVFFDLRSTSRSLRISWYADTGVAVLSIWQGGTCTGSFRLPMSDLPRMIDTLRRGPDGRPAFAGEHPPRAAEAYVPGYDERERSRSVVPASHHQYRPGPGSLRYLRSPADAAYPAGTDLPGYRDAAIPPRYPDQPGPADYPAGPGSQDFPANTSGGRYPNGAEQWPPDRDPRHYPDETPSMEYRAAAATTPPGTWAGRNG